MKWGIDFFESTKFLKKKKKKHLHKETEQKTTTKKLSSPRYQKSSASSILSKFPKPLHNNYNANQIITPQRKAAEITHQTLENSTMEELIKNDHAWVCHEVRLIHL
jgi:L-lactate utilization protein LutC